MYPGLWPFQIALKDRGKMPTLTFQRPCDTLCKALGGRRPAALFSSMTEDTRPCLSAPLGSCL